MINGFQLWSVIINTVSGSCKTNIENNRKWPLMASKTDISRAVSPPKWTLLEGPLDRTEAPPAEHLQDQGLEKKLWAALKIWKTGAKENQKGLQYIWLVKATHKVFISVGNPRYGINNREFLSWSHLDASVETVSLLNSKRKVYSEA